MSAMAEFRRFRPGSFRSGSAPEVAPSRPRCHEVDTGAEKSLEETFEPHEMEQADGLRKLDQEIDIAPLDGLRTGGVTR